MQKEGQNKIYTKPKGCKYLNSCRLLGRQLLPKCFQLAQSKQPKQNQGGIFTENNIAYLPSSLKAGGEGSFTAARDTSGPHWNMATKNSTSEMQLVQEADPEQNENLKKIQMNT